MWDCINGSGFGVADWRRQFITFQFQITQQFSTTEENSSKIIVQIEYTLELEIKQNGNLQGICFILYKYTTAKKKRPNQMGYLVGIWL